jgi:uncharacterized protein YjlB
LPAGHPVYVHEIYNVMNRTLEIYHFTDDGIIPNSRFPVVIFRQVFSLETGLGDVLILPAGTGHKSVSHSDDFAVVGAYPGGAEPDLIRLEDKRPKDVRSKADQVPLPENDPLYGKSEEGLLNLWK